MITSANSSRMSIAEYGSCMGSAEQRKALQTIMSEGQWNEAVVPVPVTEAQQSKLLTTKYQARFFVLRDYEVQDRRRSILGSAKDCFAALQPAMIGVCK